MILTNNWTDCRVLYKSNSSSCLSSFLDFISVSLKEKGGGGVMLEKDWGKGMHLFGVVFVGFWGDWFGVLLLSLVGFFALFGDNLDSVNVIFQM